MPVYAHVTLLILLPVIAVQVAQNARVPFFWGLAGAVGFFASIVLHELGHSLVAIRKGGRVRQILLLPIGGMAQMDELPARPRDELHMAAAGPAVSLALALLAKPLAWLMLSLGWRTPALLALMLGRINLMLALFNLLPSFPMDGGRIFRAWLTPKLGRLWATHIAAGVGRFIAVLFGIVALFQFNPFLLMIAFFVYQSAGAEARQVAWQEGRREAASGPGPTPERAWPGGEDEIYVSPPPYARRPPGRSFDQALRTLRGWFDDLFEKWR